MPYLSAVIPTIEALSPEFPIPVPNKCASPRRSGPLSHQGGHQCEPRWRGNQVPTIRRGPRQQLLTSADTTEVSMYDRPDLRVTVVSVPGRDCRHRCGDPLHHQQPGRRCCRRRWTTKSLSLDGILSGDDRLVGQFGNAGHWRRAETYANETAMVDIPIRYRAMPISLLLPAASNNG